VPHIVLEYSDDIAARCDVARVLGRLHEAVAVTESFVRDRIKSRAVACATFRVGSGHPKHFVHASVVFSPGRAEDVRRELGARLLDILVTETSSLGSDLSRSVEIRQFEPGMYFTDGDR